MDPAQNNPFSSNGLGATSGGVFPQPAGTGDVVLPAEKKNRKWIIAVVVAVILIAGVVAVLWWTLRGAGGYVTVDGLKQNFNKFANYVLSGEDSSEAINSRLDLSYNYYFTNTIAGPEEYAAIYKKASELYNVFWNQYEQYGDKSKLTAYTDILDANVRAEKNVVDFIANTYSTDLPGDDEISNVYINSGSSAVKDKFNAYFDYSKLDGNDYADDFKSSFDEWLGLEIKLLDLYRDNGCLTANVDSLMCVVGQGNTEIIEQATQLGAQVREAANRLSGMRNLETEVIFRIYTINALLYGSDISEYVMIDDALVNGEDIEKTEGGKADEE